MQADRYEQIYKICLQDYHTVEYGQWDPPLSPVTHCLAPGHLSMLVAGAKSRNDYGPVGLEEALRYLSGIGGIPDVGITTLPGWSAEDAALHCVAHLVDTHKQTPSDERTWFPPNYSPTAASLTAKAHSIAAYAFYRKYMGCTTLRLGRGRTRLTALAADDPLRFLVKAARHAGHAAAVGLRTPAVLLAGCALRTCLLDMSVKRSEFDHYFLELRPLWRALERCEKRWPERTPAPDDAVPTYAVCAAEECRAAVRGPAEHYTVCPHCAGKVKSAPFYCSQECRDQDWATHQGTCLRPGFLRGPVFASKERRRQQCSALAFTSRGETYSPVSVGHSMENGDGG